MLQLNFLRVIPLARFAAVVAAAAAVAAVVAAAVSAVAVKIETVEQEKRFQKFAFMAVCPFCPAQERCFIFFLVDEGASGHSGRGLASLGQGSLKTDQL